MLQTPAPTPEVHAWWQVLVPSDPTAFWTFSLFCATVGLIAVARKGLVSLRLAQEDLRLAKADIETRSKREAVGLAIEQANVMRLSLMPMYLDVLNAYASLHVTMFVKNGEQVSFSETGEKERIQSARLWLSKLTPDAQGKTLNFANALEAWSMPFVHGLADEKVATEPCSTAFCQMVITLYPHLLYQRRDNLEHSGPFQNITKLFAAWQSKKEFGHLLEKTKRWQSEGINLPPIVGTNLDTKL